MADRVSVDLANLFGGEELANIRAGLAREPYRRLAQVDEVETPTSLLVQSMHIDRLTGAAFPLVGGQKSQYMQHSVESASVEIEQLIEFGVTRLYLQLYPEDASDLSATLAHHCDAVAQLEKRFGDAVTLVADTAGLCMGDDLQWGVRDADGSINAERSLDWLATAVTAIAQSGADALVTVGRMNYEALVARTALDRVDSNIKLWAFSSNCETPNAYFDTETFLPRHASTGQKILVGNGVEMILRAIRDAYEGVDVFIQKPVENTAVLAAVRMVTEGTLTIADVCNWPTAQKLIESNPHVFGSDMFADPKLHERLSSLELGTYEVSGTYATNRLVEDHYSSELASAMMAEQMKNVVWAGGPAFNAIVTRAALWYAQAQR